MTALLATLTNKLAKQKSVSLYERQEARIEEMNKKYGLEMKPADVIRIGVDIALDQLEEKIKSEKGE